MSGNGTLCPAPTYPECAEDDSEDRVLLGIGRTGATLSAMLIFGEGEEGEGGREEGEEEDMGGLSQPPTQQPTTPYQASGRFGTP